MHGTYRLTELLTCFIHGGFGLKPRPSDRLPCLSPYIISSVPIHNYRHGNANHSMDASFQILYNSLFSKLYSDSLVEKKILSTPSFGGEVKPSVPCRRFTACKRSLNLSGSRNLGSITGQISRQQFHLSLLGSLESLRTYRQLAAKVGTSKGGGKQWQTTPKNLSRMQCARAIPVTWLGSGSCQPGL